MDRDPWRVASLSGAVVVDLLGGADLDTVHRPSLVLIWVTNCRILCLHHDTRDSWGYGSGLRRNCSSDQFNYLRWRHLLRTTHSRQSQNFELTHCNELPSLRLLFRH